MVPAGTSSLDDPRADIVQLGYLALSLLVGRRVRSLDAAREIVGRLNHQSLGQGQETPRYLQHWLVRALQVDGASFESANDAERALTEWPDRGRSPRTSPVRSRPLLACASAHPEIGRFQTGALRGAADATAIGDGRRRSSRKNRKKKSQNRLLQLACSGSSTRRRHGPRRARRARRASQCRNPWIGSRPFPSLSAKRHAWPKRVERPKSAPVKFLVEPEPAPSPTVEKQIDRAVAAALARRQAPLLHWLVAGLSFVCLVESLIIGGLLASRATTASASAPGRTPVAPAAQATTPVVPPATAPVASAATPRPAPAPPAPPQGSDVKPAATTDSSVVTLTRGWLTIEAPFELQIFEGKTLLGTTRSDAPFAAGWTDTTCVSSVRRSTSKRRSTWRSRRASASRRA